MRLFHHIAKKNEITFTSIDCCSNDITKYIQKNTKAVFIERATNPMMNVTDIEQLSKITKKNHLLFIVDNTFLSPYFQNSLKLGADIVIHSGTKYLGGHNDTLAGFLVTSKVHISEKLRFLIKTNGTGLSPFDSWLILRGIKTLGVRMETLITYPVTQTHADVPADLLKKNGITENVLRLSVGIEDADDLIYDIEQAFIKAKELVYGRKES